MAYILRVDKKNGFLSMLYQVPTIFLIKFSFFLIKLYLNVPMSNDFLSIF